MIYIYTHAGSGKVHSEDAVLCGRKIVVNDSVVLSMPDNGFIAVADGVGGRQAGEVASSFVLSELSKCNAVDLPEKLAAINDRLIALSISNVETTGMATTLSGVYLTDSSPLLVHIGNTRVYAMQGRYLKQISSDHTVYSWLKSCGRHEDAEHCNRNEITNCFGGGDKSLFDRLYVAPISKYNVMLLTSDGVHEHLTIDDLEDVLHCEIDDMSKCRRIAEIALSNGSKDDITVVLIKADFAERGTTHEI